MQDLHPRSRRQLEDEGWSQRQIDKALAEGKLVRTVHGWFTGPGDPDPTDAHLNRAKAILGRQRGSKAVLSHFSAALAHGIPIEERDPGLVHLTVPPPTRGRRRAGYHLHVAPLAAEDVVELHGMPVTSLTRTVIDLMRHSPYIWAVAAADWALGHKVPRSALLAHADDHPRLIGTRVLRQAALFADARAQSPTESASRVTITRAGLPTPELQFQVVGPGGWVATCDFAWPEQGVVGEADGKEKYGRLLKPGQTAEDAVMAEKDRDEEIRQAGWWPTHWGWATAFNVFALGRLVRGAFAQPPERRRAGRPGSEVG